jgi:predicted  nucleic acid-binding Zn-ribbon protein
MDKLVERIVTAGTHTDANGHLARTGESVRVTPREAERFRDKLQDPQTVEQVASEHARLNGRASTAEKAARDLERGLAAANDDLEAAHARIAKLEAAVVPTKAPNKK